jgi:potassium voltage-gated channel Shaker-related subfamily A beta protein 1
MGQLAIAWCLKNKSVSTVLLGATKPEQLVENLGAIEVARRITADDMRAIDEILGNKPVAYQGYGSGDLRKLESMD